MPNPAYAALRGRRRALQRLTDEMLAAHSHAAMQASGGKFNAAVDILMSRVAADEEYGNAVEALLATFKLGNGPLSLKVNEPGRKRRPTTKRRRA